ncbi:MAG: DNA gyrase subunit A [Defluviitaleaceae bacterium]|nr:DNA gyrase subunit A [Defluviitaleaceae bacterium]
MDQHDKIIGVDITEQMQSSYIDYAMSVIVARALPDARDGLKPVQRRILYAMNELNLDPSKGHKKSARITGDTMGKYHPHGESSIYDAMVRMAQDFSMRYPLVDGHGNFGSMDGDGAAAQRYTEARLSRLSMEMLEGIDQDTVDFVENYDGEFREPTVLPARFPNLLVNGSSGIAVGMATNIPPHNLRDSISAILRIIDDRLEGQETDIDTLINIIKAPDFPTGGAILGTSGIRKAYRTGRGKGVLRAITEIQPMPGAQNREMIVVSEIPYQVNKAKLVEKMADLVKDKKVDGITDIRDESNRNGVRIVIELRKDANANVVLNQLYKFSPLQETFSIMMLALDKNQPKIMNLSQMLNLYIEHQKEVITRRTQFELNKAKKRAHILEGYLKALDHIDEVIAIIRASQDGPAARENLKARFELTHEQASAIVEMRLRALTGLERERLQQEYNQLIALMEELNSILQDEKKLYGVIREEIHLIQQKYGDDRRTDLLHDPGEILTEDLIDDEETVITLSHLNYIKRMSLGTYRSQNRGGKGIIGMQTRDEDVVKDLIVARTHDFILFFTNLGRVYRLRGYEIPEVGRTARGMALVNLLNLQAGETVAAVIPIDKHILMSKNSLASKNASAELLQPEDEMLDSDDSDITDSELTDPELIDLDLADIPETSDDNDCQKGKNCYLTMITRKGIIKKTEVSQYAYHRKSGLIALNIREGDSLIAVLRSDGCQSVILVAQSGLGIRFPENIVRSMGRIASGVKTMILKPDDHIVGATIAEDNARFLLVSANGFGKCIDADDFRIQGRRGKGLILYKASEKTGNLIGVATVNENDDLMLINSEGVIIRISVADVSIKGRYAKGVKLIRMDPGVTVVGMAKVTDVGESETEVEAENIETEVETENIETDI